MAELVYLPAGRQARTTEIFLMYFVYVLSSGIRNYLYVGLTNNIERRVKQHQDGRVRTTRAYKPFTLITKEVYLTRKEARAREKYLKSGSGKEWIKKVKSNNM